MLRLGGGTHFLLLRRAPDFRHHFIDCFPRFEEALKAWEPGARVSPIFAVDKSAPPRLHELEKSWVFFFGPVFPGDISLPATLRSFLTLGLFNFVVFGAEQQERDALLRLLRKHRLRWEEWRLSGNQLVDVSFAPSGPKGAQIPKKHLKPIRHQSAALRETLREYVSIFASLVPGGSECSEDNSSPISCDSTQSFANCFPPQRSILLLGSACWF